MTLDNMKECPFCNPNREEIKFNESENFLAIYNIAPILPGHSLIIPKRHVESLMGLSNNEVCEMMLFSRDTVKILLEVFVVSGFNWTIQEGEEAGQTVPHFHLHLIPRKPNDLPKPGDWYPLMRESESNIIDSSARPRLSAEEMRSIVSRIREFVHKKQ